MKVSQLGFGAMRLPMIGEGDTARVDREKTIPMIHHAFEAGVNYIDSAVFYCNGDSQRAVGDALKGWRNKIIVSTKNNYYGQDEADWWRNLEDSLKRLQVEYIDVYNQHGMNWANYEKHYAPHISKWMAKAKHQGLIGHICCSFHDDNNGLKKLIETDEFSAFTVQYNLLDRRLEEGIALAHERNIGVVVMGPVAGGRLAEPSEMLQNIIPGVKRMPELALRFVLSNPNVTMTLSGMSAMEHVVENLATASDEISLSEADRAAIEEQMVRMKEMAELYCTGCGYCMPCPSEVGISGIFEKYNRGRIYGLWKSARHAYRKMGTVSWDSAKTADACTGCGECEEKCPQKIPIRKQLAEAHEALAGCCDK